MRLLCGIYSSQTGSIKIDGEEVFNNPKAKENIFFVSDETVQYTSYTLREIAKYYESFYPNFAECSFEEYAQKLGLPLNKRLSDFSKGMKRQSVVIAGLASRTKYLVIDEAFDGLDPAMRSFVKNLIKQNMHERDSTLIVSSHNISEISEICDHAMLLHRGKLVLSGEIDRLKSGFCKVQLARNQIAVTRDEIEACGVEIMKYSVAGSIAQVIVNSSKDQTLLQLKKIKTDFTECVPLTLEEIFIYETEVRGYINEL